VRTYVVAALTLLGATLTATVVVERARFRRALVEPATVTCEGHRLPSDLAPAAWISRIAARIERREAFLLLPEGPRRSLASRARCRRRHSGIACGRSAAR